MILTGFLQPGFFAQQDFNNFRNLQSVGDIPDDFTMQAYHKIDDDLEENRVEMRASREKVFLERVHYAINDLLHSGLVVYGDEVSQYVGRVADKLLAKDPDLRQKLRFYTIKSNQTNAFSTYQGIIFVTTGLISQLTSEAELAYVLSHEIAHYTENHVVETFDYKVDNRRNEDRIEALSNFSKDNELEADKLGIKLYQQAGYSQEQLLSTFDVLLYSYLPFEEVEWDKNYLNSSLMTIPGSFYPDKKYEITASDDADDSKSSHPNIRKRKTAVLKELENYKDWGKSSSLLGEEEFNYIRTICRFESIRTDIIDAEYDEALYSIFLLEKHYPNSLYLKRMKAKAWLGFGQYKAINTFNNRLPAEKELEGEIAGLQYLMRKLGKEQAMTVSMRMIQDLKKENPDDKIITAIWEKMIKTLAFNEKFTLEKYASKTYEEALREIAEAKKDTVSRKVEEPAENLSKYDKIKKQSNTLTEKVVIDTANFYLYALTDLKTDKAFGESYDRYRAEYEAQEAEKQRLDELSYKQRLKYEKKKAENEFSLGISSLIYLEPLVFSYNKHGVNRIKSEKLQADYIHSVMRVSEDLGFNMSVLGTSNLVNAGTDAFNERSVLMAYFSELTENEDIEVFPTDYQQLLEIRERTGTDKVMLSILEHENKSRIKAIPLIFTMFVYPTFFVYLSSSFMLRNETHYSFLVIDLGKGEIVSSRFIEAREPINKTAVEARIYEVLANLKLDKAE